MQHKALLLATSLLIPSFSWASLNTNPQLSMQGDNIRLTIPGYNPGGNVRFYIDMDNNPRTGSTKKGSGLKGADYYIENDILYAANGNTWKYVSGDLISYNNNYNNIVMEIDTTTFDKMASKAGVLNGAKKIDGFDGTVKMNVVTLDYKWNKLNTTGPTEYNILDIQVPGATKSAPSKKAAKPVVTKKKATTTKKKSKPTTSTKKTTETKKERDRRLARAARAELKAKLLARDKLKAQRKLAAKKKAAARKKATTKSLAKRAAAKKAAAKKAAAKRASAKKASAKKASAKKAPAKRASAKRASAKRAAAKKAAAKKAAARKRLEARKKKQRASKKT